MNWVVRYEWSDIQPELCQVLVDGYQKQATKQATKKATKKATKQATPNPNPNPFPSTALDIKT